MEMAAKFPEVFAMAPIMAVEPVMGGCQIWPENTC